MTVADLVTSALRELGITDVTDDPPAELSALALGLLNRILDDWNANRGTIYADVHSSLLALTAGTNPHTIGPSGATLTVSTQRPVSLEGIRLTTDDGETFLAPLTPRDAAWWHNRAAPGTTSDYPTDYYYDPTWPNGAIYFHPEPASASVKAQLWYRVVFAQVALTDTVAVPPGYTSAMLETLKEKLAGLPMFASMSSPDIKSAAREARANAFGNNSPVPDYCTSDAGNGGDRGRVYNPQTGPYSLMGR